MSCRSDLMPVHPQRCRGWRERRFVDLWGCVGTRSCSYCAWSAVKFSRSLVGPVWWKQAYECGHQHVPECYAVSELNRAMSRLDLLRLVLHIGCATKVPLPASERVAHRQLCGSGDGGGVAAQHHVPQAGFALVLLEDARTLQQVAVHGDIMVHAAVWNGVAVAMWMSSCFVTLEGTTTVCKQPTAYPPVWQQRS